MDFAAADAFGFFFSRVLRFWPFAIFSVVLSIILQAASDRVRGHLQEDVHQCPGDRAENRRQREKFSAPPDS